MKEKALCWVSCAADVSAREEAKDKSFSSEKKSGKHIVLESPRASMRVLC